MMELTTAFFDSKFRNKLPNYCNNWKINGNQKRICPIIDLSGHEATVMLRMKNFTTIINCLKRLEQAIDAFYLIVNDRRRKTDYVGKLEATAFVPLKSACQDAQKICCRCSPTEKKDDKCIYDQDGITSLEELEKLLNKLLPIISSSQNKDLKEIEGSHDMKDDGFLYNLNMVFCSMDKNKHHYQDKLDYLIDHSKKVKKVFSEKTLQNEELSQFENELRDETLKLATESKMHYERELNNGSE